MNANFARGCRCLLGGALLLAGTGRAEEAVAVDGLKEYVIGLGEDSPAAKGVRDHLAETLAEVKPPAEGKAQGVETKGGGSILCGDLFKTGSCFALFETGDEADEEPCTVGLAEHAEGRWQLRGLWKMPVVWLKAGKKWDGSDGSAYFPVEPYHEPFVLRDYNGDEVPEVLVAGEVGKYFTSSYLLKYVPKARGLELLEWTMKQPERVGKYVRLYENSGHRAIWGEYSFFEWAGDKLVPKAMWHSETPYNDEDPEFRSMEVNGEGGKVEKFRIVWEDTKVDHQSVAKVTKDGALYATVTISWKDAGDGNSKTYLSEEPWLFEKLTGIPRDYFPERVDQGKEPVFEDSATVTVAGNEEAKMRFSGKK